MEITNESESASLLADADLHTTLFGRVIARNSELRILPEVFQTRHLNFRKKIICGRYTRRVTGLIIPQTLM